MACAISKELISFRVVKLKGVRVYLEDLSLLVWPTEGTAFILLDYFMYWLAHPSALHSPEFSRCQLLFPFGSLQLVQEGWAEAFLGLYCAVAVTSLRYYQPRSLGMP